MRIEIVFPDGTMHNITSRVPDTIGRWLIETYAELDACGWNQHQYPPRIMVWPSFNPETREADWVQDTRILTQGIGARTPEEFLTALQTQLSERRAD